MESVINSSKKIDEKDRFSCYRVMQLYRFNAPVITRQCIVYFAISVLCAILTLLPLRESFQTGLFTVTWSVLPFMFYLSPLAFGKTTDSTIIERLIPASPIEKVTFYLSYCLIVIPIVVLLPAYSARYLYNVLPAIQTPQMLMLLELQSTQLPVVKAINILTAVSTVLTCLYAVKVSNTNRVLKGVLSVLGFYFLVLIFGVFYGITAAISGKMNCIRNIDVNGEADGKMVQEVISNMFDNVLMNTIVLSFLSIYIILMVFLTYRCMKRNI